VKSWCIPKLTTLFIRRMEALLTLYQQPHDPDRPLVCFDEKSVQLVAEVRDPLPMQPGQAQRQDYEYRRNGTRNLFIFVAPKVGYRQVLVTDRRTKRDFAYAMRYLVDELFPDATCIDVVLDNLNTHHYHSLVEFFGKPEADRIANRLCFHFTPPHGSWLNMAEIEISVMTGQCLKRRIPDEWSLRLKLLTWEQASNAAERQIHWSFTVDDARRVFAEHYPSDLTS
jgi:hypothetical protein